MKIIAHRGSSHQAPENTLAAVRLAWEQEADGVEIDVHLSRDKEIMVIHDPTLRRTTRRQGKVAQLTYAQLQQFDAGSWKARRWAGEPIPKLEQVLALLPFDKELLVEVKCDRGFLAPFARQIKSLGLRAHQVILIGFELPLMTLVKKEFPDLRVLWVTSLSRRRNWEKPDGPIEPFIRQVKAAGLDGVDLDARGPLTAKVIEHLHAAGLMVYVWTVDSVSQARRLQKIGVDGLTTNRPETIRQGLEN